jgi:hypothetical protein
MSNFLIPFWLRTRRHASDEDLLRLMDGELSARAARTVQKHIEGCWGCRGRYGQMQSTVLHFVEYRKHLAAPYLPPPAGGRARFLKKLEEMVTEARAPWYSRLADRIRMVMAPPMSPLLASVLILAAAAAALFWVWQRNPRPVSANELLERAALWDAHPSEDGRAGVVYQKVRIHTKTATVERALYRDADGRRRPRVQELDSTQSQLKDMLEQGGVDWQRPLSASGFRDWHNNLKNKEDEVKTSAEISTLRTTTDSGEVQEETLTVRNADFHPVARRLILRDSREIEISELNYDVLGWKEVNTGLLFEPEPGTTSVRASAGPAAKEAAPMLPTVASLDEAELRARLALNRMDADTAEQISVTESRASVVINGFVENEERKKEIENGLGDIPLVTTSIRTFEEQALLQGGEMRTGVTRVNEYSVIADESPFDRFFAARSVAQEERAEVSRKLFAAALTIQREALALDLLEKRFPNTERSQLSSGSVALLAELRSKHKANLASAMSMETSVLDRYSPPVALQQRGEGLAEPMTEVLLAAATQNKKLCDEALQAGQNAGRPAEKILAEMHESLDRIQDIAGKLSRQDRTPFGPADRNP